MKLCNQTSPRTLKRRSTSVWKRTSRDGMLLLASSRQVLASHLALTQLLPGVPVSSLETRKATLDRSSTFLPQVSSFSSSWCCRRGRATLHQQQHRIAMNSLTTFTNLSVLCLSLALFFATSAHAAALTTSLAPHERSCFYAWVDKAGEKVGFYFAVQSGGSFDIDYDVVSPSDRLVTEGKKERQLDIIFTGNEVGEYSFCFENDMSSFADKVIDFDITVESEPRLDMPISQAVLLSKSSAPLEESIMQVDSKLTQVERMQRYFRTWENRGFATVKGTQNKIFYYSIIESIVMMAVAAGQVYVVRWLFEKGSTKRYRV